MDASEGEEKYMLFQKNDEFLSQKKKAVGNGVSITPFFIASYFVLFYGVLLIGIVTQCVK